MHQVFHAAALAAQTCVVHFIRGQLQVKKAMCLKGCALTRTMGRGRHEPMVVSIQSPTGCLQTDQTEGGGVYLHLPRGHSLNL